MNQLQIKEYLGTKFIGDLYSLEDFIEICADYGIIPYDGTISKILINGHTTNIYVYGWGMHYITDEYHYELQDIEELRKIPGFVQIIWCNK